MGRARRRRNRGHPPDGETGYLIDYTDDQAETGRFSGRVGWIGDRRVLEVEPSIASDDAGSVFGDLLLPGRLLFVVSVEGDELHTRGLDRNFLRDHLRHGETWVPHLAGVKPESGKDDHLVLTGTSTELRAWLRGYLDRTDALGEETVWRKVGSE